MHKEPQEIIFDGTEKDNQQIFPASINTNAINVTLQCRPDLIIEELIIIFYMNSKQ